MAFNYSEYFQEDNSGMNDNKTNMDIVKNKVMENKDLFTNIFQSLALDRSQYLSSTITDPPSISSFEEHQPPTSENKAVGNRAEPINLEPEPEVTLKTEYVFPSEPKPDQPIISFQEKKPEIPIQEKPQEKDPQGQIMFEFNEDQESDKDQPNIMNVKHQEESLMYTQPQIVEFVQQSIPKKSVKKSGKKQSKNHQKVDKKNLSQKPEVAKKSEKRFTRSQQKRSHQDISVEKIDKNSKKKQKKQSSSKEKPITSKKDKKEAKMREKVDSKAIIPSKTLRNQSEPQLQSVSFQIVIVEDSSIRQWMKRKQKISKKALVKIPKNESTPHLNGISLSKIKPVNIQIVIPVLQWNPSPNQQKVKSKKKLTQKASQAKRLSLIISDRSQENRTGVSKINLGSCSILEIVQYLNDQGIIKSELYQKFAQNHTIHDIRDFLNKFTHGQLQSFDFGAIPFTLLDHRRLAELATKLFPQKYEIKKIVSLNKDVNSFLQSLYELDAKKYFELYKTIDGESNITWWKEIISNNKDKINRAVKPISIEKNQLLQQAKNLSLSAPKAQRKIRV